MNNNNTNEVYSETCPICGIVCDKTFTVFKFSSGSVANKDKVFSRVCMFLDETKKNTCINKSGIYKENEGWLEFTQ